MFIFLYLLATVIHLSHNILKLQYQDIFHFLVLINSEHAIFICNEIESAHGTGPLAFYFLRKSPLYVYSSCTIYVSGPWKLRSSIIKWTCYETIMVGHCRD